jgi:hypothetical protein
LIVEAQSCTVLNGSGRAYRRSFEEPGSQVAMSTRSGWRSAAAGAILAVVLIAVLAGAAYVMGWRLTYQPAAASCLADDAIGPSARNALERAALDFVNEAAGKNPMAAYAMLASDTRSSLTPDKFMTALRGSLDPVAPFGHVHVTHAYLVRSASGGATQRVICGDLDQPDDWVAVTARPIPTQAHLVVAAAAKGDQWAFVLWLVPENGWKVAGFNFTAASMAGKSPSDLVAMARAQHALHHEFNATLLLATAAHLAARGKNFQLGIEPHIEDQMRKLSIPALLRGKPPLDWKIGEDTYKIDGIGAAGIGHKIYLAITQELSPWHSDDDADTRNRVLIHDFVTAVPEYSALFSGLILLARDESGGHFYRTIATYQKNDQPAKK